MIVNADVSGLELYVAADWYDDPVLKDELLNNKNIHEDNQARFKLPELVIAKVFVFRVLFGGTEYGFSVDSDFLSVGFSQKQWRRVIEQFYEKYPGIQKGHLRDIKFVKENGYLEIPSGRYFNFAPVKRKGESVWPESKIKNYPVQGGGADLVKLARIEAFRQFREAGLEGEFIGTIHDSLKYDVPAKNVDATVKILVDSIAKVPEMCYNRWSYKFSLPMRCKVYVGKNSADVERVY